MNTPPIFLDDPELTKKLITLAEVHDYKILNIAGHLRITAPDKKTKYHYGDKKLLYLTDKDGYKYSHRPPLAVSGFYEALVQYIFPTHSPKIIYVTTKIVFHHASDKMGLLPSKK